MRFSDRALEAIDLAGREANRLRHGCVGTEHLLLALMSLGTSRAAELLAAAEVDITRLRSKIEGTVGHGEQAEEADPPFTPAAKRVLELAVEEAQATRGDAVGTEHLLIGLIREGAGVAAAALVNAGLDAESIRARLGVAARRDDERDEPPPEMTGSALEWTNRARSALAQAQEEARRLKHIEVRPEHLVLGLCAIGEGVAFQVLKNLGTDVARLREEMEMWLGRGTATSAGEIPSDLKTRRAVELAIEEASSRGDRYLGTEHLLLGLLRLDETRQPPLFDTFGLRLEAVREEVNRLLR